MLAGHTGPVSSVQLASDVLVRCGRELVGLREGIQRVGSCFASGAEGQIGAVRCWPVLAGAGTRCSFASTQPLRPAPPLPPPCRLRQRLLGLHYPGVGPCQPGLHTASADRCVTTPSSPRRHSTAQRTAVCHDTAGAEDASWVEGRGPCRPGLCSYAPCASWPANLCRLAARSSAAPPRPGCMQTTGWAPCRCVLARWQQPAARRCSFSGALQGSRPKCALPEAPPVWRQCSPACSQRWGTPTQLLRAWSAALRPLPRHAPDPLPCRLAAGALQRIGTLACPPSRGQQHRQQRQRNRSSRRRSSDGC